MGTWYAAHVVMIVEFKEGKQDRYPVWENIVLVEADTPEAAFEQAEAIGRQDEGDADGTFRWGNRPARWVFGAVRKLTTCVNERERPTNGTEVSYLELEVRADKLDKYLRGGRVSVILSDMFADDGLDEG